MKGIFNVIRFDVVIYLKNGEIIEGYWKPEFVEGDFYTSDNKVIVNTSDDSIVHIPIDNTSHWEVKRVKEYFN